MDVTESAYKLTVGYTGKKNVVTTYVIKSPMDLERLFRIRDAHESDPDSTFVTLFRTRRPRPFNYKSVETTTVDDSGIVSTPKEKSLLFKQDNLKVKVSRPRSEEEKIEWARNYKSDDRTCIWM